MDGKMQHIFCGVQSCRYNVRGHSCDLKDIFVAPIPGQHKNLPEETMCQSYQSDDDQKG